MRIIKEGNLPDAIEQEKECFRCGCVFAFTNKEIQYEQREGSFVACPTCGAYISASAVSRPFNRKDFYKK